MVGKIKSYTPSRHQNRSSAQNGTLFFIVAYNNVIDFNTNFVFVKHVLSMDTTFKSPPVLARAITDESTQKLLYESLTAIAVPSIC